MALVSELFDTSDFPARWGCGNWTSWHGWTHILSDIATFGAYAAIPFVLAYFILRRRDVPFPRIFWLFCAFIFACGTTHLIEAAIFWWPIYRVSAVMKVFTAVVSWVTVIGLAFVMPKALAMPGIAKMTSDLEGEIAQRRRIEEALSESASHFKAVVETAADAIITISDRGIIEWLNPAAERLFGYQRQELTGVNVKTLMPSPDSEQHDGYLQRYLATGQPRIIGVGREVVGRRRDGSMFPMYLSIGEFSSGGKRRFTGIIHDLTERKRADELFRLAVESSPSAMVMIGEDGRITLVNAEAEQLFGYLREELMGKSVEMLVPERFRAAHPGFRSGFMAQPQARPMGGGRDLFALRKDGTEVPVEIGLNPIQTSEGMMVLSAIVDVTERRRAQQAIIRANEELKNKHEEMEQFLYTVSHDLKAPLVTTVGFLGFLKEDLAAGKVTEVSQSVEQIDRAAKRMSTLIHDLLRLNRVGRIESQSESVDVAAMVRDVWATLTVQAECAGATLQLKEPMPTVWAERRGLADVFENLLTNALKYGCVEPASVIEVGGQLIDNEHRYYVRDHGPGIDPAYHHRIFRLFERLDASKDGTGVGLALVEKIIERHGGRAWVESTRGHGAIFWIAIPISSHERPAGPVASNLTKPRNPAESTPP